VGDNVITLSSYVADEAYTDPSEYEIRFHEALDADGIDIKASLVIIDKTAVSFTVNSLLIGTLKWETFLKVPNFNYWT
jgi:hypothetical protein